MSRDSAFYFCKFKSYSNIPGLFITSCIYINQNNALAVAQTPKTLKFKHGGVHHITVP